MRFDEVAKASDAIEALGKAEADLKVAGANERSWDVEFSDRRMLTITHVEMLKLLSWRREEARATLTALGVTFPATAAPAPDARGR